MSLIIARRLIDVVIILLVLSHIITWVEGLSPTVISILISLVYLLSYRMARGSIEPNLKYYVWMWLPTILFVILPVIWQLTLSEEKNLFSSLLLALPLFSLIIPVGLLFIARSILDSHIVD